MVYTACLKGGETEWSKSDCADWARRRTPSTALLWQIPCFPRDGRFIEEIGTYNPMVEPSEVKIDAEKVKEWMKNGAQPTETVKALLKREGIL